MTNVRDNTPKAGQQGWQTLPPKPVSPPNLPAIPEDEKSEPYSGAAIGEAVLVAYEDVFAEFESLALQEKEEPLPPLYEGGLHLTDSAYVAATAIAESFDEPGAKGTQVLQELYFHVLDKGHPTAEDGVYMDAELTVNILQRCSGPNIERVDSLIEDVKAERVILTRGEVKLLTGVHEVMLEQRAAATLNFDSGEGWIDIPANRNCELCGQFISSRVSHYGCTMGGKSVAPRSESSSAQWRDLTNVTDHWTSNRGAPVIFYWPRHVAEGYEWNKGSRVHANMGGWKRRDKEKFSEEFLVDAYAGTNSLEIQSGILARYLDRERLHRTRAEMNLPSELRRTVVDYPYAQFTPVDTNNPASEYSVRDLIEGVAAVVSPPLESYEVQRLIERGGPDVTRALLTVKATRQKALFSVQNTPSYSAAVLAADGTLSAEELSVMATSPDPLVRRNAARGANLTSDDAQLLANDAEEDVRRALVDMAVGYEGQEASRITGRDRTPVATRYPVIFGTLLMDPSEELAVEVLRRYKRSPAVVKSLRELPSRSRLTALRDGYRAHKDGRTTDEINKIFSARLDS